MDRLPEDAQTLHAETLALLLAIESERSWSHLSGSFATKSIKGMDYVYFQYSDPGGTKRQFSVGRRNAALDEIISEYGKRRDRHESDLVQVRRLAGLLRSAGLDSIPHGPARVLGALADAGVFRLGGVLIGSYAFQALGNLLGVKWPAAAWRTQDVDVAAHLRIAVPKLDADVPKTLESLQMGFVPIPQLDPDHPSTSFRVRGQPLRVDLLTPGQGRDESPVYIPRFKAAAQPIPHLSIILHEAQPAVAVDGGATLVVVPSPARYALHKLFVSQTRSIPQQSKAGKDMHQAALLLEILAEDRPTDLEQAARAVAAAGPTVTSKISRALDVALKRWPNAQPSASIIRLGLSQA